jgi:formylglycine-generating enzyme required for sulfatase activity
MAEEHERKIRVFISYARRDSSGIAEEIRAGLKLAGFDAYLDKHDIEKSEDWEQRLSALIVRADTVVFVISPAAVASRRCGWEVDRALELGKRLVPVQWIAVPEAEVPLALKRLNYVFFSNVPSITHPLTELAETLRKDIGWIRIHTLIGEQATRWHAEEADKSKAGDLLLRGSELAEAQVWVTRRKPDAPHITELQSAFLAESASQEKLRLRRTRRTKVLLVYLSLLVLTGGLGWWQQQWLTEQYYWRFVMKPAVMNAMDEASAAAKPGSDFKECALCPTMVVVPKGRYRMGSENHPRIERREQPAHDVTIGPTLAVGKFEITFDEWDACASYGDCRKNVGAQTWGRGQRPVINVSWRDAQSYIGWLSRMTGKKYRLLSEAEWEYAARGGKGATWFWFGNDEGPLAKHAWFETNAEQQTHPVGQLAANPFGLHDMYGNVYEWTDDCFNVNYEGAPEDGTAWLAGNCTRRVVRGGSWLYGARILRSANRDWQAYDKGADHIGFRIARNLGP